MKKITLKISAFLLLAMVSFQAQAQEIHTEIVVDTQYNLRNAETDQYLRVTGDVIGDGSTPGSTAEVLTMIDYPAVGVNDYHINWSFVATELNGAAVWNVQAQARGIMRMKGSGGGYGAISTAFQGPRPDSDKVNIVTYDTDAGGFRIYNGSGSRVLAPVTVDGAVTLINEDPTNVVGKSDIWVLEVSEMTEPVASVNTFGVEAFLISNPVNNQLTIKGAISKVSKVSLYSVLGNKVLSKVISGNGDIKLDVNALSTGLYILEMSGNNGERFTKKIVKQ